MRDSGLEEDAQYFDIPDHHLDNDNAVFFVDHRNWPAWQIFLECSNQWRRRFDDRAYALDYTAVIAVIGLHAPKKPKKMLRSIRLIELGVLGFQREIDLYEII